MAIAPVICYNSPKVVCAKAIPLAPFHRLNSGGIVKEEKTTSKRRLRRCPKCGSGAVAVIFWGLPESFSKEMQHEIDEGRLVLGGCCVTDCDPAWQCTRCGLEIYREADVIRATENKGNAR